MKISINSGKLKHQFKLTLLKQKFNSKCDKLKAVKLTHKSLKNGIINFLKNKKLCGEK